MRIVAIVLILVALWFLFLYLLVLLGPLTIESAIVVASWSLTSLGGAATLTGLLLVGTAALAFAYVVDGDTASETVAKIGQGVSNVGETVARTVGRVAAGVVEAAATAASPLFNSLGGILLALGGGYLAFTALSRRNSNAESNKRSEPRALDGDN